VIKLHIIHPPSLFTYQPKIFNILIKEGGCDTGLDKNTCTWKHLEVNWTGSRRSSHWPVATSHSTQN